MIEQNLYEILSTNTALNSIVSNRIYPLTMSQGTPMPVIIYQKISNITHQTLDGSTGLNKSRFQFTIYSNSYKQTKEITNILKSVLGTDFSVFYENEIDGYESEINLYSCLLDVSIWHQE